MNGYLKHVHDMSDVLSSSYASSWMLSVHTCTSHRSGSNRFNESVFAQDNVTRLLIFNIDFGVASANANWKWTALFRTYFNIYIYM